MVLVDVPGPQDPMQNDAVQTHEEAGESDEDEEDGPAHLQVEHEDEEAHRETGGTEEAGDAEKVLEGGDLVEAGVSLGDPEDGNPNRQRGQQIEQIQGIVQQLRMESGLDRGRRPCHKQGSGEIRQGQGQKGDGDVRCLKQVAVDSRLAIEHLSVVPAAAGRTWPGGGGRSIQQSARSPIRGGRDMRKPSAKEHPTRLPTCVWKLRIRSRNRGSLR